MSQKKDENFRCGGPAATKKKGGRGGDRSPQKRNIKKALYSQKKEMQRRRVETLESLETLGESTVTVTLH